MPFNVKPISWWLQLFQIPLLACKAICLCTCVKIMNSCWNLVQMNVVFSLQSWVTFDFWQNWSENPIFMEDIVIGTCRPTIYQFSNHQINIFSLNHYILLHYVQIGIVHWFKNACIFKYILFSTQILDSLLNTEVY